MNRLNAISHLRNPLMTPKQCNWMEPIISGGKVIGTKFCPKDVWAEYRVKVDVPDEIAGAFAALESIGKMIGMKDSQAKMTEVCGGYYCALHFMRMVRTGKHSNLRR